MRTLTPEEDANRKEAIRSAVEASRELPWWARALVYDWLFVGSRTTEAFKNVPLDSPARMSIARMVKDSPSCSNGEDPGPV